MGEEAKQVFVLEKMHAKDVKHDHDWVAMEDGDDFEEEAYESTTTIEDDESSSVGEDSGNSVASSTSSDLVEDDDGSSPSTLLSHGDGPLYELSELMAQLPIKRGLSKFYQGKSQSYTSLASVKSLEDLAKKESSIHYRRSKMKSCKSYAGIVDGHTRSYGPKVKAIISKKGSRSSGSLLSSLGKRGSLVSSCRPM